MKLDSPNRGWGRQVPEVVRLSHNSFALQRGQRTDNMASKEIGAPCWIRPDRRAPRAPRQDQYEIDASARPWAAFMPLGLRKTT